MDLERSIVGPDGVRDRVDSHGRIARLALDMSAHQTRHVLDTGALESTYGAELLSALEDAIRDAISGGASLDEVAAVTRMNVDELCRARAGGLLRSKAAVLSYVEEHLLEDSQGEVSVTEVARLRQVLQTARGAMEEAIRRSVATGMAVDEVVGVAHECGVAMSREEVVLAFHQRRR